MAIMNPQTKKTISLVLTNSAVAVKDEVACIDTSSGLLVPVSSSTTLLAIGWFTTNTTGDGTTKVLVDLFNEIRLINFANDDAPNNVQISDIGSEVYLLDGSTVTTDATSRSTAGIAITVSTDTVGVLCGIGLRGATGAAGTGADSVASRTALAAVGTGSRYNGQIVMTLDDGALWRFVSASSVTMDGSTAALSNLAITPGSGSGRWLRSDKSFDLKLAIDSTKADAAVLCTVPAQMALRLAGLPFWEVSVGFTGGTGSAIGISSDATGATTKGDLLGGATGDVTATLGTAGLKPGTLGGKLDTIAHEQAIVLAGGKVVRFDRITDAFTAGSGFVHIPVTLAVTA